MWMGASLTTGTLSSLLMQRLTKVTGHPTAQVVILIQYMGHFLYASYRFFTNKTQREAALSTRQITFARFMGLFHVFGFLSAMPSIDRIGVALYQIIYSSGIVILAVVGRVVLRKCPSPQQGLGIAVACAGLAYRGYVMVQQGAVSIDAGSADTLVGIALAFFTTLSFNLPPVLMELANKGLPVQNKLTSLDVGMEVSKVGCLVLGLYVGAYTVPRWEELMAAPLAASGTSYAEAAWYLANTALYIAHNTFFLETTRSAGSLGNGLVNAVRSATVVLSGAAIFCPTLPNMCLDAQKGVTVALLVAGGVIYTFAPPAIQLDDVKAEKEKKKQ